MKTLQQRYLAALLARGCEQVPSRSQKVITVTRPQEGTFYFLGKAGSLRVGYSLTRSIPVREQFKARLLAAPAPVKREQAPIIVNMEKLL